MPDVLHIVVIFHDFDELFHQLHVLFVFQSLVVLGNHFDLGGDEGVENRKIPNFLTDFAIAPELSEILTKINRFANIFRNSVMTYIITCK